MGSGLECSCFHIIRFRSYDMIRSSNIQKKIRLVMSLFLYLSSQNDEILIHTRLGFLSLDRFSLIIVNMGQIVSRV